MNFEYLHFIDEDFWLQKVDVTCLMTHALSLQEILCQLIRQVVIRSIEYLNLYIVSTHIYCFSSTEKKYKNTPMKISPYLFSQF